MLKLKNIFQNLLIVMGIALALSMFLGYARVSANGESRINNDDVTQMFSKHHYYKFAYNRHEYNEYVKAMNAHNRLIRHMNKQYHTYMKPNNYKLGLDDSLNNVFNHSLKYNKEYEHGYYIGLAKLADGSNNAHFMKGIHKNYLNYIRNGVGNSVAWTYRQFAHDNEF